MEPTTTTSFLNKDNNSCCNDNVSINKRVIPFKCGPSAAINPKMTLIDSNQMNLMKVVYSQLAQKHHHQQQQQQQQQQQRELLNEYSQNINNNNQPVTSTQTQTSTQTSTSTIIEQPETIPLMINKQSISELQGRAKTVRIGRVRWPPPIDQSLENQKLKKLEFQRQIQEEILTSIEDKPAIIAIVEKRIIAKLINEKVNKTIEPSLLPPPPPPPPPSTNSSSLSSMESADRIVMSDNNLNVIHELEEDSSCDGSSIMINNQQIICNIDNNNNNDNMTSSADIITENLNSNNQTVSTNIDDKIETVKNEDKTSKVSVILCKQSKEEELQIENESSFQLIKSLNFSIQNEKNNTTNSHEILSYSATSAASSTISINNKKIDENSSGNNITNALPSSFQVKRSNDQLDTCEQSSSSSSSSSLYNKSENSHQLPRIYLPSPTTVQQQSSICSPSLSTSTSTSTSTSPSIQSPFMLLKKQHKIISKTNTTTTTTVPSMPQTKRKQIQKEGKLLHLLLLLLSVVYYEGVVFKFSISIRLLL
jgi:hypothetical protein